MIIWSDILKFDWLGRKFGGHPKDPYVYFANYQYYNFANLLICSNYFIQHCAGKCGSKTDYKTWKDKNTTWYMMNNIIIECIVIE